MGSLHYKQTQAGAWWYTPVIQALRRGKEADRKFKTSLDYIVRPCLKQNKTTTTTKPKAKQNITMTKKFNS
jgi:hypothetical protein